MTDITPAELQQLRARLERRAEQLRAEVGDIKQEESAAEPARETVRDFGDQGEERAREAVRSAEENRDRVELREVAAALQRMKEDRYGVCTVCGREIPLARLRAQPAAARCLPCQQRYEKAHPLEPRAAPMH
jgi:RNA polymerase-binding protein DksA